MFSDYTPLRVRTNDADLTIRCVIPIIKATMSLYTRIIRNCSRVARDNLSKNKKSLKKDGDITDAKRLFGPLRAAFALA